MSLAASASSLASTSRTFDRLVDPVTTVTARRDTPNAEATAPMAAAVAAPSTGCDATATMSASPCRPPTLGRDDPGFTRIARRTVAVWTLRAAGTAMVFRCRKYRLTDPHLTIRQIRVTKVTAEFVAF